MLFRSVEETKKNVGDKTKELMDRTPAELKEEAKRKAQEAAGKAYDFFNRKR